MISKRFLLVSLSFFSVFSISQTIDPNLITQLSPDQIQAAQEVLEAKDLEVLESQDLPETEESLVKIEEKGEKIEDKTLKKFGYDFFQQCPPRFQLLATCHYLMIIKFL